MAGLVEAFVTKHLPEVDIDFLTGLCDEYQIVVPDAKKDKKPELLKLVMRYLSSEALEATADKGAAVFLKLFGELDEVLAGVLSVNVKPENLPPPLANDTVVSETTIHKLKKFKVQGKIGTGERVEGEKDDSLTYTNLLFQISQAENMDYKDSEIYAAVVSAIKPGNPLRDMLEIKGEQTKEHLLKTLQSHFGEKDSQSVLQDLRQCTQKPKEQAKYFFMRAIALREKVKLLSSQEGIPMNPDTLTATFFKSLSTGLKQNNIRMVMWQTLKDKVATDEDLLEEVALATACEQERVDKSNLSKANPTSVTINQISADESDSSSDSSDSSPVAKKKGKNKTPNKPNKKFHEEQNKRFEKLSAQISKLSTSTNTAINELRSQVATGVAPATATPPSALSGTAPAYEGGNVRWGDRGRNGRPIHRCEKCRLENSYWCDHCFKCCKTGHKRPNCPLNVGNEGNVHTEPPSLNQ